MDGQGPAAARVEGGSSRGAGWGDRTQPPAPSSSQRSSQRSSHAAAAREGESRAGDEGGNGSWVEGSGRSAEGGAEINEIDKRLQALHAFLRAAKEGEEHAAS